MSYFAPFIDDFGVHMPTYEDRLQDLCSAYRTIFGQEAELTPAVPDYQLLSVLAKALDRTPKLLRWLLTFVIVLIGWIIFYYTDFGAVRQHLLALVGVGGAGWMDAQTLAVLRKYTVFPLLCLALSLPWVPALGKSLPEKLRDFLQPAITVVLFAVSVLFLVGQSYNPFIYFRF